MIHYRVSSTTCWVQPLRSDEILAIACGFDPKHIPGIGTFYDFLGRFYRRVNPRGRVRKPARKPSRRLRPGHKQPPKHAGVIRKIVNRLLQGRSFHDRTEMVPSASARGLAPAGGAPEANWGWDSYRKRWVRGHDAVMSLRALSPRSLYPQFTFSRFLRDSAHDSYPFHHLLELPELEADIDLNPRNTAHPTCQQALRIDRDGTSTCPRGYPMVQWGYCPDRQRIKWRRPQGFGQGHRHQPDLDAWLLQTPVSLRQLGLPQVA